MVADLILHRFHAIVTKMATIPCQKAPIETAFTVPPKFGVAQSSELVCLAGLSNQGVQESDILEGPKLVQVIQNARQNLTEANLAFK